ncbi:methyltransferase domain-containing protein [Rhodovulum sulfidophilum]|nr:methyltransferase domain-containing protein [Rhodovulum sulfidophilum]
MPSNDTTPAASACGAGRTREDWNRRYSETEQLFGIEPNIHLARELSDLPPGRALDLACGEGRNSFWLAERGWQVDGIDLSDVAVERARAGGTPGTRRPHDLSCRRSERIRPRTRALGSGHHDVSAPALGPAAPDPVPRG